MKLIDDIYNSFNNNSKTEGFSARKLSAFAGVMVAMIATFRFCDEKILVDVIIAWLLFALLCMGIITLQQVIDFRAGKVSSSTTTTEKTKVEKVEKTD